jgi:hypothetical protein
MFITEKLQQQQQQQQQYIYIRERGMKKSVRQQRTSFLEVLSLNKFQGHKQACFQENIIFT